MKLVYIVAMEEEATPFIQHYGVEEVKDFFKPLPCKLFKKEIGTNELYVVLNGKVHGTNLVGCESAAVATLATIYKLEPDLIVNSGTCGAFKENGAEIGKVYIGNGAMFHDRRVPGDDEFFTQTLGNYSVWDKSKDVADALGLSMGKITTGSSLDMQDCDLEIIKSGNGELKDMEGAAVGFVCSLTETPVMFVKSVTDLCDDTTDTYEDFKRNLSLASEALKETNIKVIDYLFNQNL